MNDPNDSTGTVDGPPLSSNFLEFCAKVRNSDPSVLPEHGQPLRISHLREKEVIELADALLENTNATNLFLGTSNYTKSSAKAMAKYVRTSKCLQRICWARHLMIGGRVMQQHEEMLCCFLPAIQESTSLKELEINFPRVGGSSNLAFENMLTHTQSLQSLRLWVGGQLEDMAVAAAHSGLRKNTTLRELTLEVLQGATTVSPILTSLSDHPLLQRLCLRGYVANLTGLETVLLSDNSKITELEIEIGMFYGSPPMFSELEIHRSYGCPPIMGLTNVLQAMGRHPALTKLELRGFPLVRDDARLLRMILCKISSLQTLVLTAKTLGSVELVEIAPALYHNTSIKVLDISKNDLSEIGSAEILRDVLRINKTMTTLDLSENEFGQTTGAVECIAEGLGFNSTLLKIDLSNCALEDGGVSTLAQTLSSRNMTLQKLSLDNNFATSTSVGVLLEMMEQNSLHITDLDLRRNPIGSEGAYLLVRSLGNNTLPNLTRLSLPFCDIGNNGFISLTSALEQNTSLLHLVLHHDHDFSEGALLALAESLPKIKALQRVDFDWCTGLASAMPLLLAGLRQNTSLFRFHVAGCAPSSVPPTPEDTARCAGGWMQEMEWLGYRNRFLSLLRVPKERLPPRGVWSHALARIAIFPHFIFKVLRSKPNLVMFEDTEGKEAVEGTGTPRKRKHGDE
jgi:Leucine-rich repeat (LRR) protein